MGNFSTDSTRSVKRCAGYFKSYYLIPKHPSHRSVKCHRILNYVNVSFFLQSPDFFYNYIVAQRMKLDTMDVLKLIEALAEMRSWPHLTWVYDPYLTLAYDPYLTSVPIWPEDMAPIWPGVMIHIWPGDMTPIWPWDMTPIWPWGLTPIWHARKVVLLHEMNAVAQKY